MVMVMAQLPHCTPKIPSLKPITFNALIYHFYFSISSATFFRWTHFRLYGKDEKETNPPFWIHGGRQHSGDPV